MKKRAQSEQKVDRENAKMGKRVVFGAFRH
jgi:hypothetical protein